MTPNALPGGDGEVSSSNARSAQSKKSSAKEARANGSEKDPVAAQSATASKSKGGSTASRKADDRADNKKAGKKADKKAAKAARKAEKKSHKEAARAARKAAKAAKSGDAKKSGARGGAVPVADELVDGRLHFESTMDREEVAAYFESLVKGLRKGSIHFRQNESALHVSPSERVEVEVKVGRKKGRERLSFEIEWRTDEPEGLTIVAG